MNVRRLSVALGASFVLLVGSASLAGAGTTPPHDILATPSQGEIGQVVVISNAVNSPCGGGVQDGPAEVLLSVDKPDLSTVLETTVPADASGNWSYSYTTTDQIGTYRVKAFCQDVPNAVVTSATDFSYTETTFVIAAAVTTTTTAAPVTTTTAAPAPPAVAAAAQPTFTG
jgi:hypothetical protein